MKIIKLKSENVLRLNAVEIEPDGNLIVIGGDNGHGKTSVLDSILLAMGGRQAKHVEPLKKGTKKGKTQIDLGDLTVTRTFTKKGGYLKVEGKDGSITSPQKILDKIAGQLTFDPLVWSNMDSRSQVDTLKNVVGLDFTDIDKKRKGLYEDRSEVNREIKRLQGVYESIPFDEDAPNEEISVSDLTDQLYKANENNQRIDSKKKQNKYLKMEYRELIDEIEGLKVRTENLQKKADEIKSEGIGIKEEIGKMSYINESEIRKQLSNAESINEKVRSNKNREMTKSMLDEHQKQSDKLTNSIDLIDIEKEDLVANAEFPVDGLGLDETGVTYNGIPFIQASSAEKLRVSVAMGIALNPELKILLIRDGSLLDKDNLAYIAKMAELSDHQVWIERVGKGEECSVIIEDGGILEEK